MSPGPVRALALLELDPEAAFHEESAGFLADGATAGGTGAADTRSASASLTVAGCQSMLMSDKG